MLILRLFFATGGLNLANEGIDGSHNFLRSRSGDYGCSACLCRGAN